MALVTLLLFISDEMRVNRKTADSGDRVSLNQ